MAKPPAIQALLDSLAKAAGYKFATMQEAHNAGCCIKCGEPVNGRLRTDLERKEYMVSGFCGICWEELFNEDEGDQ